MSRAQWSHSFQQDSICSGRAARPYSYRNSRFVTWQTAYKTFLWIRLWLKLFVFQSSKVQNMIILYLLCLQIMSTILIHVMDTFIWLTKLTVFCKLLLEITLWNIVTKKTVSKMKQPLLQWKYQQKVPRSILKNILVNVFDKNFLNNFKNLYQPIFCFTDSNGQVQSKRWVFKVMH